MRQYVLFVFAFVYAGMVLGRIPGLALDRTGVAVLGAIAVIAGGVMTVGEAYAAVDVPTAALLFGLMVVSAQFRLGGFYTLVTRRLTAVRTGPRGYLALVMAASAALSALLANDIVCLAMTPILVEGCRRRGLDPLPHLLGLAIAANIGSAATLIGNPQNMLIGEVLGLSFGGYLAEAAPPVLAGLVAAYGVICLLSRGRWLAMGPPVEVAAPAFNPWQSAKGLVVLGFCLWAFLFSPWPREAVALVSAGALLLSRELASRDKLALVDWQLLLLFIGLFVVNAALAKSGLLADLYVLLGRAGCDLGDKATLFIVTAILSNVVSNVPAVMLLLPAGVTPEAGVVLALSSTLAGNLVLPGSIANLIVAEEARKCGVPVGFRGHLRVGVPVTLVSLALAGAWLWWRAGAWRVALGG